jgi:hypothetical protein
MKTIIALLATLALSACGGGGNGPAQVSAPVPASAPEIASGPIPTGGFDGSLTGQSAQSSADIFVKFGNYPFFGGALFSVDTSFPDSTHVQMNMSMQPNWTGNILFKNDTTNVSVLMSRTTSPAGDTVWQADTNPPNLIRNGVADTFTVVLSN